MSTRILSIDGGGVLGCGPVEFLKQMELYENWFGTTEDVLAGTSVGGLLVALRATGRSWTDISDVFDRWVKKIFATPPFWWRMDPTRPQFQDDGIKAAVQAELGSLRCRDAKVPFFIPSFDFANGRPKIFDMTDDDLLSDVVLRTTAAPTYFQPRDGRWADGALATNNPSVIAICGAVRKLGKSLDGIKVLSLNTGGTFWDDPHVDRRMTKIAWAMPMINSQLEGSEELADFQATALLGDRHLRLTPALPKRFPIDDPSKCPEYRRYWSALWSAKREEVKRWLDI